MTKPKSKPKKEPKKQELKVQPGQTTLNFMIVKK